MIPSFGGLIYTIGAFVIALLIIVAVHEYGHYIVGRWTGIYAEVFSLGFGPVIWSRKDKHGTRWQLAAFPLGGYVKFLGDANAASGKDSEAIDAMDQSQRRHSMHSAPLWARALTVAAGPVFNFILSILIFGAIIGWRGVATDPLTIAELLPVPVEQGLQVGDEILAIDGVKAPKLEEFDKFVLDELPEIPVLEYTVRRGENTVDVTGPHPFPAIVSGLNPGSAAIDAGLELNDYVLTIDGEKMATFATLRKKVGNSDGEALQLAIWRNGETLDVELKPKRVDLPLSEGGFETRWLIGISGGMAFVPETQSPGILKSAWHGVDQTFFIIESSLSGLYHMATGAISSCNMRGPIGIAQTSGEVASQGLSSFIWFIAVLSTAVGMLNLFPIPVLDGGHLVFHGFEAVTGRPPSDRALRILMAIGLTFILALMVFALSNDLTCP